MNTIELTDALIKLCDLAEENNIAIPEDIQEVRRNAERTAGAMMKVWLDAQ